MCQLCFSVLKSLVIALGCISFVAAVDDHSNLGTRRGLRGSDCRDTPCGIDVASPVVVEPGRHSRRGASVEQPRWLKLPEPEVPELPKVVPCASPAPAVVMLSPGPAPEVAGPAPAVPVVPEAQPTPVAPVRVPILVPPPAPPPVAVVPAAPSAFAPPIPAPVVAAPVTPQVAPVTQCPPACPMPPITITMNLPPWPAPPMPVQAAVQSQAPLVPAPVASPGAAVPAAAPPSLQSNTVTQVTVPVQINHPPIPHEEALQAPQSRALPPSPPPAVEVEAPRKPVDRVTKNMTAELLEEYNSLHKEVHEEWESWQGLASSLGPKMEHLHQASNSLKAVVSSVHDLHIPSVASLCSQLTSCDSCAASSICGWCTSALRCVPGTPDGILEPGSCGAGDGADGAYSFSSCPGMGCDAYSSCGQCTLQATCGWCGATGGPGHCLQGSEWGPMGAAPGGPNAAVAASCPARGPSWIHSNGHHSQC